MSHRLNWEFSHGNKSLHTSCLIVYCQMVGIYMNQIRYHPFGRVQNMLTVSSAEMLKDPPPKKKSGWMFWAWYKTAFSSEASVLELWGFWGTLSLPLFPHLLQLDMIVLLEDSIYRSSRSVWKLLVLDRNVWNHITVCKQMIIK